MKHDEFYMLIGSIFLAPHVSATVGVSAAAVYMVISLWLGVQRKAGV